MASTTFCVETVKKSLEADGFSDLQDSTVGDRILDMELRKFPFATVYGLEFCSFVIFHERIRSVLEASFGNCSLGHSMRYKKKPGRIFCYISSLELARHTRTIPGGPEVGYPLMVHLWAKGSQVDYYIGSHKHELPILEDESSSKEPLFEIPRSALVKAGCEPKSFTFEHGGVIIADARIAFELKEGYVITDVFFPDRLLPRQKMILPYSGELTAKVDEIKKASGRIGLNFGFKDMPRSTND